MTNPLISHERRAPSPRHSLCKGAPTIENMGELPTLHVLSTDDVHEWVEHGCPLPRQAPRRHVEPESGCERGRGVNSVGVWRAPPRYTHFSLKPFEGRAGYFFREIFSDTDSRAVLTGIVGLSVLLVALLWLTEGWR